MGQLQASLDLRMVQQVIVLSARQKAQAEGLHPCQQGGGAVQAIEAYERVGRVQAFRCEIGDNNVAGSHQLTL